MKRLSIISLAFGISMLPAMGHALVIDGYATDNGSTTQVGSYSGDVIQYYIPIDSNSSSGTYGVSSGGTYGTVQDSDYTPLGEVTMDMYIYFDITAGYTGDSISLWFRDLDLGYNNDPAGFFETIAFGGSVAGLGTEVYESWAELDSVANVSISNPSPSDNNDITVTISGLNLTGDFWLNLQFTSYNTDQLRSGTYYNTREYLSASLTATEDEVSVPAPGAVFLFGTGLLALAGFRRRKS